MSQELEEEKVEVVLYFRNNKQQQQTPLMFQCFAC